MPNLLLEGPKKSHPIYNHSFCAYTNAYNPRAPKPYQQAFYRLCAKLDEHLTTEDLKYKYTESDIQNLVYRVHILLNNDTNDQLALANYITEARNTMAVVTLLYEIYRFSKYKEVLHKGKFDRLNICKTNIIHDGDYKLKLAAANFWLKLALITGSAVMICIILGNIATLFGALVTITGYATSNGLYYKYRANQFYKERERHDYELYGPLAATTKTCNM